MLRRASAAASGIRFPDQVDRIAAVAVLGILGAVVATNLDGFRRWINNRSRPHSQITALAVIPLENLSRDPEQEYFADGMTDEIDHQPRHDQPGTCRLSYFGNALQTQPGDPQGDRAGTQCGWDYLEGRYSAQVIAFVSPHS